MPPPGSSKSSNDAAVVSSFCSHSQKTAGLQEHFPVRMKQHSTNCFKSLPRSIRTDFVKTRSWAGRATLRTQFLIQAPQTLAGCICLLSWEQAGSITSNAFNWEGKWKLRRCCQWVHLQPYQSPKEKLSKRRWNEHGSMESECNKSYYNTRKKTSIKKAKHGRAICWIINFRIASNIPKL